ncbi:hypothetical protein K440DRAFT_610156 [Wilcoxina mikolae CBS 423.85]|nr:hypothetical protein K440DRAFT_610156 [Wilcoxina mikolae CBS 423.85]
MLGKDSNFAEAVALRQAPAEPVLVSLEDDPAVMGIILRVLHFLHKKVPRKISVDQLVQAAIICDKYGLHEALQLISETWTKAVSSTWANHPEDWLLISWVFGPADVFTNTSRALILSGLLDSNGDLVFGEYKGTLHECVPSSISDKIIERRRRCIESVRAHVRDLESKFLCQDWQSKPVCPHKINQCDSLQLGLLYRCLLVSGAFTWSVSINAVRDALKKIPTLQYNKNVPTRMDNHCQGCRNSGGYSHLDCSGHPLVTYQKNQPQHTDCSWVPKLHKFVENTISGVKGFSFSEFSSRTWG